MTPTWSIRDHLTLIRFVGKWLLIGLPLGGAVGWAVALFLWLLDRATTTRLSNPWLLYLLPVGGACVAWMYKSLGESVEAGNNLIIDRIHKPGGGVPARMGPLVLIGTVLTHLFGGSAGREGTAVQIGGSLADAFGRLIRIHKDDVALLLTAGVAAGFGAVFGTPLAGAIFAAEVLTIGVVRWRAVVPCLIASVVADHVTGMWGIVHTSYSIGPVGPLRVGLLLKVAAAAVAFGLAGTLFAKLTHRLTRVFKKIKEPTLRPTVGGVLVIALAWLIGPDYLGLGVTNPPGQVSIVSSFSPGGVHGFSWGWKMLFTAVTLASGFKGGEVTPLFFIGASLGNVIASMAGAPVDLMAGLGFVAVFAGATNTPLACTIMGVELFGSADHSLVVYLATACFGAYLFSGHGGIYHAQRVVERKV